MRYYTRYLHDINQDDIATRETNEERAARLRQAERDSQAANMEYLAYLRSIQGALSSDLDLLSRDCLHDAVIAAVQDRADVLQIILDTAGAPFTSFKTGLTLCFTRVTHTAGLHDAVGQTILHEEIFVDSPFFEYSALLHETEICVRFRGLFLLPNRPNGGSRDRHQRR